MRPVGRDFLMRDTFKRVELVVKRSLPRRRKDCPICGKRNLVKLSNHLADIYQLSAVERKYYLSGAKYLSDPEKPGDMSSRKRLRSDSEDDMSTVARDEKSEEEMSSPKRMRNESDDETSTVSNKDIFNMFYKARNILQIMNKAEFIQTLYGYKCSIGAYPCKSWINFATFFERYSLFGKSHFECVSR